MGATNNCQPMKPTQKEDQADDSNVAKNSDDDEEDVEGKGLSMYHFASLLLHSNLTPPYEVFLNLIINGQFVTQISLANYWSMVDP